MLRRIAFAVAGAVAAAAPARGQIPADSAVRWVDSIFAPYTGRSPGCAVGVTRGERLALTRSYGLADLTSRTPISENTRFYIASLSKQFTAMSVVLLAQDGRLSLDDTVRKWIPEVPSFGRQITLRQLLHHTSGLRDYMTLLAVSGWQSDGELSEQQFLDLVRRQKNLNFVPGDEFLYSNTGYALLSIVVRRVSGKSLRDFAAERIFGPLGMTSTEFRDDHTRPLTDGAIGYETSASGPFQVTNPRVDVVGDAGVYSTIADLAKWEANFSTGKIGGREGVAMLMQPGHLNNGQAIPYGLALTLGEMRGMKTIAHSGSFGGYRSTMLRFPEVDIGVITLCNTSAASATLAEQVGALMLGVVPRAAASASFDFGPNLYVTGAPPTRIDSAAESRRRNDQLAQMAGSYYSDELELPVSLVVRDGALFMRRPKSVDMRFGSFATDLFTSSDKMLLRVVRDARGAVAGFTLTINRVRDLEFVRRP
jgi:CubicO group peptidase (beta-lactamase class C family)